jgi:hypothetical protein
MQLICVKIFAGERRDAYSSICVNLYRGVAAAVCDTYVSISLGERRGGYATHMCHFIIRERRGACSSICVKFISGSDAGI